MSSTTEHQAELPDEELVAYLDGELSPDEARRVEQRLARDENYRQQLRDLDQAWEALDALPAATVDDHFARTTIEMVSVAAEQDASQRAAETAAVRRKTFWTWAASGVAATLAGFALARTLVPNENERLLADLPVIRQFDHLNQIEHLDFLRTLPTVVPLEQMTHDAATVERELTHVTAAAAPGIADRRQWIENLLPEEMSRLASQAARFSELAERDPDEEQRLRAMERELRGDQNADELRQAMVVYNKWLAQRSPGDQEHLRVLSDKERLKAVAHIVRREGEEAARNLSAEDAAKLREEIFEIYRKHRREFESYMEDRGRDLRVRLRGPERHQAYIVLMWALQRDNRDDRTRDRLIDQLSPAARDYWKRISRRGRRARQDLLLQWIRQAMRPRWGAGELEEFFTEKLDNDQRAQLLSLPADEMQAQLERLYIFNELRLRDTDDWLPGFGDSDSLPGDPPGRGRPDGRRGERSRPSRGDERRGGEQP